MPVFDSHTHVFPDKVHKRAIEVLVEKSHGLPAFTDGSRGDQERAAFEAGYDGWLHCTVVTNARQMRSVNDWVATWNTWPHLSLGGLYPNAPLDEVLAECRRIRELGLLGVKFHPEYQQFEILDERLAPMWETLSELRLPVLFHAGNDIGFIYEQRHSAPSDYARLSERYPELVIICAHMGGWNNWDEVEKDLCGANVFLDTSFSKAWMTDQEQFERIIRKHGVKRILFGTDSPWTPLDVGLREIESTGLSREEKDAIFYGNAAGIFPLPQLQ
ncbi:MAG: amidohydrolase family protein [Lentisphaeria bacterium]|nr:amidohydrolase family protein [Lentisphaeria bacterium]